MPNTSYIYGLRSAHDAVYFYIGSTRSTPKKRLQEHLYEIKAGVHWNVDLARWVQMLGPTNVVIDVIDEVDTQDRFALEYLWIEFYLNEGAPLLNYLCVKDGRVTDRRSNVESQEERRLMSDIIYFVINRFENIFPFFHANHTCLFQAASHIAQITTTKKDMFQDVLGKELYAQIVSDAQNSRFGRIYGV